MKLINNFVEHYPDIRVRQVTMTFTIKDCPSGITPPEKKSGRAFQFYLCPRLYAYLQADDKKRLRIGRNSWLTTKFSLSRNKNKGSLTKRARISKFKDMITETAPVKESAGDESEVAAIAADDDGDETEEEATKPPDQ